MEQFVIRLNLSKYFTGDKAKVVVLADSKWGTVQKLKEHIEGMFQLKDVEFKTTDGCWIPFQENINLLKHIDLVEAYSKSDKPIEENHNEVVADTPANGNVDDVPNLKRKFHTIQNSFSNSTPNVRKKSKVNNVFSEIEHSPILCQTVQLPKISISPRGVQVEVDSKVGIVDACKSLITSGTEIGNENSLNRKKKRRIKKNKSLGNNNNNDSAVKSLAINPLKPSNSIIKSNDKPNKHTIFTDDLNNGEASNNADVSNKEVDYEFVCAVPNAEKFILTENVASNNGTQINDNSMQIEEISAAKSEENLNAISNNVNGNENNEVEEENNNTIESNKGKRIRKRNRKNKKTEDNSTISSETNNESMLNASCEGVQQQICLPSVLNESQTGDTASGCKDKTSTDLNCDNPANTKNSHNSPENINSNNNNNNNNNQSLSAKVLSSHNETSFSVDDASLKDSSLNRNILGKSEAWSTEEEAKDSHSASKIANENQSNNNSDFKTNSLLPTNQNEKDAKDDENAIALDEIKSSRCNVPVDEIDISLCEEVSVTSFSYQKNNETSVYEEVSCLEDESCSIIALDSSDEEESNMRNNSSRHYSEQDSKQTLNIERTNLNNAEMLNLAKDLTDVPKVGDYIFFKLPKIYKNNNFGLTNYMTGVCQYVNKRSKSVKVKLIEGERETEFILKSFFSNLDATDDRQNLTIKMEDFREAKIYVV